MKTFLVLLGLALTAGSLVAAPPATAASPRPSIRITSPHNGATIHGTSVRFTVAVSHFTLVKLGPKRPHGLTGRAGHINYSLDFLKTGKTVTFQSTSTSRVWTHLVFGRQKLVAHLATIARTPPLASETAAVSVLLAPVVAAKTVIRRKHAAPNRARPVVPHIRAVPRTVGTGGGASISRTPLDSTLLIAGLLILIIGLVFLGHRFAFATPDSEVAPNDRRVVPSPVNTQAPEEVEMSQEPDVMGNAETETVPLPVLPANDMEDEEGDNSAGSNPEPVRTAPYVLPDPGETRPAVEPGGTVAHFPSSHDAVLGMARQWGDIVGDLVSQLDAQEAERRRLLERMRELEETVSVNEDVLQRLEAVRGGSISEIELETIRRVTSALQRDPEHIVVLAAVAQHAATLHEVVEKYASLRSSLEQQN